MVIDNLNVTFIAITEHWQSYKSIEAYQIENYKLISAFCRNSDNVRGGAALYALNSLNNCVIRLDINKLSEEYKFECTAAEFTVNNMTYLVCVIYRPPSSTLEHYLNKLDELLELALTDNIKLLIAGDFNIDMLKSTKTPRDKNLVTNVLNSYNMTFSCEEPTRVTKTSKTCLDNVYLSRYETFEIKVLNTMISDHFAQFIKIQQENSCSQQFECRRIFSGENYKSFFAKLDNETWLGGL